MFIYVIDLCLDLDELQSLKDTLIISLSLLPQNAVIGLITFGNMVQLHEIGFLQCPKAYVFQGLKDIDQSKFGDMLGISGGQGMQRPQNPNPQQGQQGGFGAQRFLQNIQQSEYTVSTLIENLLPDPWPVSSDKRPKRCTGVAVSVAVQLLEVF